MLRSLGRTASTATVCFVVAMMALTGCDPGKAIRYAAFHGPPIFPLPVACHYAPVPKAIAYINTPVGITPLANGGWLVADGGTFNRQGSKVVEFDAKGKAVFAITGGSMSFVHSAVLTTRGNILISDTNNNRVIEIDPRDCRDVFNTDRLGPHGHGFLGQGRFSDGGQLLYPNDAEELANGHYLISSRLNSTLYEIDRHGHVFWRCHSFTNLQGKPDHLHGQHNPHRLPNGDTIISDSDDGRIIIVNPGCTKMVWEYTGHPPYGNQPLIWPRDAEKMNNGDILIDDSIHNRCLEVNMSHHTVRRYYNLPQPYSCVPLPNGVVASGNTVTHGIVLWSPGTPLAQPVALIPPKPLKNPFGRPPTHLVNGSFESPEGSCVLTGSSCTPDSTYPPSGGTYGWQPDDLLTETLPPGTQMTNGTKNANMALDTSVSLFGNSSAKITWTRKTPHAPIWWGQTMRVFPYRKYQISYYIVTHNVQLCKGCDFGKGSTRGKYAYLGVSAVRPGPYAPIALPSFPKLQGTTKTNCVPGSPVSLGYCWQKYSQTYFMPQGTRFINIQCLLTGRGTVWFDGVKVRMTPWRPQPGT